MGPSGAWAWTVAAKQPSTRMNENLNRWCDLRMLRIHASTVRSENPHADRLAPGCTAYLFRRTQSQRRCRRGRALPTIKVRLNWRTSHARRKTPEAPTRPQGPAPRSPIHGQHAGAADPYPRGVYSPPGAAQEGGHWRHHRDVRLGAHRITRNRGSSFHTPERGEN